MAAPAFSEQLVTILDTTNVPQNFREFLLKADNNCTTVELFAALTSEERD